MGKEEQLLEYWRELSPEAQEQVLQFAQSLKSQPEFVPQTPLGKRLWEIRQRAIAEGMKLLTEEELEQIVQSGNRKPNIDRCLTR